MVGEEEVTDINNINDLPQGAGKNDALKPKEIFEGCPHLELTRRDLIVMCQSQGANSSAGHHGFNLVELLQNDVLNGPVWGDHPIQQPSRLLKCQTDGLQRALAAGE